MARVFLGLGSNIDAAANLRFGIGELRRRYGDLDLSETYRSAAVGFDGPDFLNLVVALDSGDSPAGIHEQIEAIHSMVGRVRGEARLSSRPLDIDLLLYDDVVMEELPLRLPRPDILEYGFVLRPLAELVPDLVHPVSGRTMAEHWRVFDKERHPLERISVIW
jgi:2-amino-4-hydroxy-6-hydroxymethyldihydropteridine diphosphokinase